MREIDPELLSRASRVLEEYYQRELEKNPEPYEMLDEIYCNYKSCLFYQGKITCTELLEDYRKFCEHSMEHDDLDSQEGVSFLTAAIFRLRLTICRRFWNCWRNMRMNITEHQISVIFVYPIMCMLFAGCPGQKTIPL